MRGRRKLCLCHSDWGPARLQGEKLLPADAPPVRGRLGEVQGVVFLPGPKQAGCVAPRSPREPAGKLAGWWGRGRAPRSPGPGALFKGCFANMGFVRLPLSNALKTHLVPQPLSPFSVSSWVPSPAETGHPDQLKRWGQSRSPKGHMPLSAAGMAFVSLVQLTVGATSQVSEMQR